MKRRVAKKVAKRYLNTGLFPKRYLVGFEEYYSGYNCSCLVTCLRLRYSVLVKAIYNEAYCRGWDGCHWDNPLVISIESYIEDS